MPLFSSLKMKNQLRNETWGHHSSSHIGMYDRMFWGLQGSISRSIQKKECLEKAEAKLSFFFHSYQWEWGIIRKFRFSDWIPFTRKPREWRVSLWTLYLPSHVKHAACLIICWEVYVGGLISSSRYAVSQILLSPRVEEGLESERS